MVSGSTAAQSMGAGGISSEGLHLVVTNKPNTRCLIVFVVGDHDVVSSHLQQVALRHFDLARPSSGAPSTETR